MTIWILPAVIVWLLLGFWGIAITEQAAKQLGFSSYRPGKIRLVIFVLCGLITFLFAWIVAIGIASGWIKKRPVGPSASHS